MADKRVFTSAAAMPNLGVGTVLHEGGSFCRPRYSFETAYESLIDQMYSLIRARMIIRLTNALYTYQRRIAGLYAEFETIFHVRVPTTLLGRFPAETTSCLLSTLGSRCISGRHRSVH